MAEGSAATDEHELIDAHAADLLVAGVYGVHIIADAGRHPPPAAEDAELHVALVDLLVAVHEVDGNAVLLVALHDHVPHRALYNVDGGAILIVALREYIPHGAVHDVDGDAVLLVALHDHVLLGAVHDVDEDPVLKNHVNLE